MKITVSKLYVEPGVSFEISYKVAQQIEKILNQLVSNYCKNEKIACLSLIVSTKTECHKAEAKGPSYDKKNRCKTWGIWLPYKKIVQSPDQVEPFLTSFFEAVQPVFADFGVPFEEIKRAEEIAKAEMVKNQAYQFNASEKSSLDLSKIKL